MMICGLSQTNSYKRHFLVAWKRDFVLRCIRSPNCILTPVQLHEWEVMFYRPTRIHFRNTNALGLRRTSRGIHQWTHYAHIEKWASCTMYLHTIDESAHCVKYIRVVFEASDCLAQCCAKLRAQWWTGCPWINMRGYLHMKTERHKGTYRGA